MLSVKILGTGCANCKRLEEIAREAAAEAGIAAEFVKVSDYADIAAYGVMSTPGLVIEEKVVSAGRLPTVETVRGWLNQAAKGK